MFLSFFFLLRSTGKRSGAPGGCPEMIWGAKSKKSPFSNSFQTVFRPFFFSPPITQGKAWKTSAFLMHHRATVAKHPPFHGEISLGSDTKRHSGKRIKIKRMTPWADRMPSGGDAMVQE